MDLPLKTLDNQLVHKQNQLIIIHILILQHKSEVIEIMGIACKQSCKTFLINHTHQYLVSL